MTAPRDPLAPPRPGGHLRAVVLAILAHAALIAALTLGLNWKKTTPTNPSTAQAELWAAAPQQAAPPPTPTTTPRAAPQPPKPRPEPEPPPPPPPELNEPSEADIALEREREEKKRLEEDKQRLLLEREQLREKLEREKAERQEKEKQLLAQQQLEREKAEQAEKAEQEKQKKLAEEKRKAQQAEARRARELREEQLRRLTDMAGTESGSGNSRGTAGGRARQDSGPSAGYAARVIAAVRPNITYSGSGNPRAVVEVRASPDGTIIGVRLLQPSNDPAWNEAAVRALHKTAVLPRDVDGRVHPHLVIDFRPRD